MSYSRRDGCGENFKIQRNKIYNQCACFCEPLLATIPKSWPFVKEWKILRPDCSSKFIILEMHLLDFHLFRQLYFAISLVQNIPQYQNNHGFRITNSDAQDILANAHFSSTFFFQFWNQIQHTQIFA